MKCEVRTTDNFEKAAKPLLEKYKSLKHELVQLESELIAHPDSGTSLGHNVYKVRLAIRSKGQEWRSSGDYLPGIRNCCR